MKRLLLLLALLLCASGARAQSFTLVQHHTNFTCAFTTSGSHACTVSGLTSTVAGHLLVILSAAFEGVTGGSPTGPTFVSASGDGAWTHCPAGARKVQGITASSPLSFEATDCAYILSATGGATSVTFTWSGEANTDFLNVDLEFIECSLSAGTFIQDTQGTTGSLNCFGSGGSACIGPGMTLATTSELCLQWIGEGGNTITSISGGAYTNPFDNDTSNVFGAFAGALNQSSGSAQTWVVSGTTGNYTAMSAISFKSSAGVAPAKNMPAAIY